MKKRLVSFFCDVVLLVVIAMPSVQAVMLPPYQETLVVDGIDLPKSFFQKTGILVGDQQGSLNWDQSISRIEATIMVLRLLGAEDDAQARSNDPSPFLDVPIWANGYVNCAYQKNIVKGTDAQHFSPFLPCTAPEFATMILRLTDLREGTSADWENPNYWDIIDYEFRSVIGFVKQKSDLFQGEYPPDIRNDYLFYKYIAPELPFTRECAAALCFRILSLKAGSTLDMSLADKLIKNNGLSFALVQDHHIRQTSYSVSDGKTMSLYLTGPNPTVFTLDGNNLTISDSNKPRAWQLEFQDPDTSFDELPCSEIRRSDHGSMQFEVPNKEAKVRVKFSMPLDDPFFEPDILSFDFSYLWLAEKGGQFQLGLYGEYDEYSSEIAALCSANSGHYTEEAAKRIATAENAVIAHPETPSDLLQDYVAPSAELDCLSDQIIGSISDDYEKAKAICEWVSGNIYYDFDTAGLIYQQQAGADVIVPPQDSVSVLRLRRGVCAGFSALTYDLLMSAGIPALCIESNATNHAWNECFANRRWITIDNTFDSSGEYREGHITAPLKKQTDFVRFDSPYDEFYSEGSAHRAITPGFEGPPFTAFE